MKIEWGSGADWEDRPDPLSLGPSLTGKLPSEARDHGPGHRPGAQRDRLRLLAAAWPRRLGARVARAGPARHGGGFCDSSQRGRTGRAGYAIQNPFQAEFKANFKLHDSNRRGFLRPSK